MHLWDIFPYLNYDFFFFFQVLGDLLRSCVQSAVGMLRDVADSGELSTKRVENLLTLLDESETQG